MGGVIGGGAYQVLIHPFLPARVRALQFERTGGQPALTGDPTK